jgi:hypothetical protein
MYDRWRRQRGAVSTTETSSVLEGEASASEGSPSPLHAAAQASSLAGVGSMGMVGGGDKASQAGTTLATSVSGTAAAAVTVTAATSTATATVVATATATATASTDTPVPAHLAASASAAASSSEEGVAPSTALGRGAPFPPLSRPNETLEALARWRERRCDDASSYDCSEDEVDDGSDATDDDSSGNPHLDERAWARYKSGTSAAGGAGASATGGSTSVGPPATSEVRTSLGVGGMAIGLHRAAGHGAGNSGAVPEWAQDEDGFSVLDDSSVSAVPLYPNARSFCLSRSCVHVWLGDAHSPVFLLIAGAYLARFVWRGVGGDASCCGVVVGLIFCRRWLPSRRSI